MAVEKRADSPLRRLRPPYPRNKIHESGGSDVDAIHDNVASEITVITEKTTPIGADEIIIEDSADSNNKKSVKLLNVPASEYSKRYTLLMS